MRIKIISDGSGDPGTTRVVNAETGEQIEMVRAVSFTHRVGDMPCAMLDVLCPAIEAEAQVGDAIPPTFDDLAKRYKSATP